MPAPGRAVIGPLRPPERLLMGPGPVNVDPRVLAAMAQPMVGQFDPVMTTYMNEVMALYRDVFVTSNAATFLVDGTARAGIEAVLVSVLRPGDRVLVPIIGRFGHLLAEIAERAGAEVVTIDVPWGEVFPVERIVAALDQYRPRLVAMVQGDTSTTMCQPLEEIGALCRARGVLTYVDVTASIGGNTFRLDEWQLDAASAGLQKCLGGPPGTAPVTLDDEAVRVVRGRRSVEAGINRDDCVLPSARRIRSNYFDIAMLLEYWGPERLNHHTEATSMLYAAHEAGRLLVDEGIDVAVERHRLHGAAMLAGVAGLDLEVFGDRAHRMHNVVGVLIPAGVDGEAVRAELLARHGIEIGTSFGPLHGRIWRIGTMGYNARPDAVLRTLAALEDVLDRKGGVDAAERAYAS